MDWHVLRRPKAKVWSNSRYDRLFKICMAAKTREIEEPRAKHAAQYLQEMSYVFLFPPESNFLKDLFWALGSLFSPGSLFSLAALWALGVSPLSFPFLSFLSPPPSLLAPGRLQRPLPLSPTLRQKPRRSGRPLRSSAEPLGSDRARYPSPDLVTGVGFTRLSRYHQNTISSCGALF